MHSYLLKRVACPLPHWQNVTVWEVDSGTPALSFECNGEVRCLQVHEERIIELDGKSEGNKATIFTGSESKLIGRWQPDGPRDIVQYLGRGLGQRISPWLSKELLLHRTDINGRSLITHAAATNNTRWIESILKSMPQDGSRNPVATSILRPDHFGRHALDYAVRNAQPYIISILFDAVMKAPPPARSPLLRIATPFKNSRIGKANFANCVDILAERNPALLSQFLILETIGTGLQAPEAMLNNPIGWPWPSRGPKVDKELGISSKDSGARSLSSDGEAMANVNHLVIAMPGLTAGTRTTDKSEINIFHKLASGSSFKNLHFVGSAALPLALDFKWKQFARKKWLWMCLEFLVFIVSYIVSLTLMFEDEASLARRNAELLLCSTCAHDLPVEHEFFEYLVAMKLTKMSIAVKLYYFTTLISLHQIYRELKQLRHLVNTGKSIIKHFTGDVTNIAGILLSLLNLVLGAILEIDIDVARQVAAVGLLLSLSKLKIVCGGIDELGDVLDVIEAALGDALPTTGAIAFLLMYTSFALRWLTSHVDDDRLYTGWMSMLMSYKMLLGDTRIVEIDELYEGRQPLFLQEDAPTVAISILFVTSSFMITILLLNLMIGALGETVERVLVHRPHLRCLRRAQLIVEIETMEMSAAELDSKKNFPFWVHVVQRAVDGNVDNLDSDIVLAASGLEWSGRLQVIRRMHERTDRRVRDQFDIEIQKREKSEEQVLGILERIEDRLDMKPLAAAVHMGISQDQHRALSRELSTRIKLPPPSHGMGISQDQPRARRGSVTTMPPSALAEDSRFIREDSRFIRSSVAEDSRWHGF